MISGKVGWTQYIMGFQKKAPYWRRESSQEEGMSEVHLKKSLGVRKKLRVGEKWLRVNYVPLFIGNRMCEGPRRVKNVRKLHVVWDRESERMWEVSVGLWHSIYTMLNLECLCLVMCNCTLLLPFTFLNSIPVISYPTFQQLYQSILQETLYKLDWSFKQTGI